MANRFQGSYRDGPRNKRSNGSKLPRGVRREVQSRKRDEARERDRNTPHERRKRHRLGKCKCERVAA